MKKVIKIDLVNAKEISISNPDTFYYPPDDLLNDLQIGSIVKICDSRERFWLIIKKVKENGYFEGEINNFLFGSMLDELKSKKSPKNEKKEEYNFGDILEFHKDNIFDINIETVDDGENNPEYQKYLKEVEREYKLSMMSPGFSAFKKNKKKRGK